MSPNLWMSSSKKFEVSPFLPDSLTKVSPGHGASLSDESIIPQCKGVWSRKHGSCCEHNLRLMIWSATRHPVWFMMLRVHFWNVWPLYVQCLWQWLNMTLGVCTNLLLLNDANIGCAKTDSQAQRQIYKASQKPLSESCCGQPVVKLGAFLWPVSDNA